MKSTVDSLQMMPEPWKWSLLTTACWLFLTWCFFWCSSQLIMFAGVPPGDVLSLSSCHCVLRDKGRRRGKGKKGIQLNSPSIVELDICYCIVSCLFYFIVYLKCTKVLVMANVEWKPVVTEVVAFLWSSIRPSIALMRLGWSFCWKFCYFDAGIKQLNLWMCPQQRPDSCKFNVWIISEETSD